MASFVFKKQPSDNRTKRYSVKVSRMGHGLGRKAQMTAEQMTTVTPGIPCNWPHGTDRRAPVLPNEAR
jgi:hypothetical protein